MANENISHIVEYCNKEPIIEKIFEDHSISRQLKCCDIDEMVVIKMKQVLP